MKNRLRNSKNILQLWTLALLMFIAASTGVRAQIQTYEFVGLAGNEATAISNVTATGLGTGTISRGSGLSQSSNAQRFNASSWATGSIANAIAGNDYMEITITPDAGYEFTVSSIFINVQRSGTGLTQMVLRSSADGYASDLGGAFNITDNTSTQSFTFTFAQAASSTPVTYRFYGYAEATGGSGGIGDGTGDDLIISGTVASTGPSTTAPTVSTTAASAITATQASSGGNVTDDGGDPVTARGVVWGATANPTVPSANSTSNGTGTGTYSSTISPLTANTTYNYRAYATNGVGTSYGTNATFTTLPIPPTAAAANTLTSTSFNATWTAPTMGPVAYTYSIEVSETNTFGVVVFSQNSIASGTLSAAVSGLTPATDYYYRVQAVNAQGASVWSNITGPVTTLTPAGPIVSTTPALAITANSATLYGTIDANGTTANAFFDYGLTIAYGTPAVASPASVTGTGATAISFNATGLIPNTLYNYRARANAGVFGANRTFVTLAAVPGAITFSAPTSTTITISAVNANGNPATTEFAISSSTFGGQYLQFNGTFGPIPYFQTASNWVNTTIPGLSSATTYSFAAIAQNSDGISTVAGPTGTSTTSACATPVVVLSNISNNSVTITLSNPTGDFEYVVNTTAAAPGAAGTPATGNTVDGTGLTASTAYFAHVRSVCGSNFSSWTTTPFSTLANPVGLVTYLFTGCTSCPSAAPTTADAGVAATDYIRGAGLAAGGGSDYYNNQGYNIASPSFATADVQGDYVSFTVAPNAGYQVTYSSLDFRHRKSGTGPGNTRVGYSTNGGTSWTYMTPDPLVLTGTGDVDVSWTFPSAFSTANTVIFRIWAWGASSATGTYRNDNVVLSGYVSTICNNPVTQSTDVVFSNETNVSADISWTTAGTSDLRKVFISNTNTGSPTLANGTDYAANSNFGSGDAAGSWYCIYSGTGNTVTVSNLLPGQTYRVFVANTNCSGIDVHYLNTVATGNPANVLTTNVATPVLSSGPLSSFGSSCVNFDTESEVLISGSVLNGSTVTVSAPAGFALTLVSGENYTSSVTIPYTGGTFATPVYVRFLPTAAIAYTNNLTVSGGGATSITVPVSGTGISIAPTVSTGASSFIGLTGATLSGSLSLGCAGVFSEYGIEYSVSPAFTPGNGAIVQSAFTGNNFSVALTNLGINTIYYYRAYGINNAVTYYGAVGSFSTLSGALETIYNYGDNTFGVPFYVHPTVLGSNVAKSSTGWTNSTPCGSGYSGFGLTSAATSFNATTNAYVEATITPNVVGNQVEIERISVQLRSSTTAADQVMLAYSTDDGATWVNRGVAETPAIGTSCGVTSSNSWLLSTPVTVGSPLAANSIRIRLYYYNTSGAVLGNNQILNLVVLGRVLQSPSTYYSVSGGNFTDAIWSPSSTGTVGAQVDFTPEINAVILTGDNVILNASDVLVKNLTIQSGASLRAASTDFSNMRNISLYGNLTVSGAIGNGTTFDAIGLNIEGPTSVISGTGAINVGRIRKQSNYNVTSNLSIQSNVNVRFPGAAIYNNAPNSFFNLTLAASRSLNVTGSGGTDGLVTIDGLTDNDVDQKAGSLTINGTLNITGNLSVASSNNINPYLSSLTIGSTGLVSVKNIDTKVNAVNATTINAGGRLNVSGIMRHRQGTLVTNGGITLGVGGILLHGAGTPGLSPDPGGLISGNIRVRAQGTTTAAVYNYWSSPVASAQVSSLLVYGANLGSAANTYKYDPSLATDGTVDGLRAGWVHEVGASVMTPGVGYITTSAGSVQFNGTPNNGNISVPAAHGAFTDFNLVGNPYPGPLDAATFMTANQAANIIPALYFWDDDATLGVDYTTNDYIVSNAVGTVGTGGNGGAAAYAGRIATGQSFFVETRSAAPTINFDNSMRTSGTATFFEAPSAFEKLWLRVNGDNSLSNEALIAFGGQATDGYDDLYDAKKIAASADIALYTTAGDMNFAIQALSALTDSKIVPVGFDAAQAGNYTFSISNIEGIDPTVLIYLEDRTTGVFHNLRVSNYSVGLGAGINGSDRFFLHFSKAVEVTATAETCSDNDGSIQIAANANAWNYLVKTADNAVIANGTVGSTEQTIANLNEGVYIIEFTIDGYTTSMTSEVLASAPVQASVSGTSIVSVNEQATFAATSNGASSLTWDFGDGSTASGSLVNHTFQAPGIYVVTLFASNGTCSAQSTFEVIVDQDVTGLAHVDANDLRIFPNPANEVVTLVSDGVGMVQITDLTGKVVMSKSLNMERVVSISTSEFANGVYLVQIVREGVQTSRKLIIAH